MMNDDQIIQKSTRFVKVSGTTENEILFLLKGFGVDIVDSTQLFFNIKLQTKNCTKFHLNLSDKI